MKRLVYNHRYYWQLICLASILLFILACQKDRIEPPVITGVLNYEASPNDTVVNTIHDGQWVVLVGRNLSGVTQVNFGSIPALINTTFLTNNSIVVQIPSIPFQSVSAEELNVVTVISEGGVANYNISIIGDPLISYIRNYEDPPNDTIVNMLFLGQYINIVGYNLGNATEILFQGIEADLTSVVYTDTSAIVQVPADLSDSEVDLVDMISYTNRVGTGSVTIKILGSPIITSISNENPNQGDAVYLYGNNFVSVQNISFAGTEVPSYEVSANGSSVQFIVPALTQSGPIVITTSAGSFTTVYNVNDLATGVLCNFDDISPVGWDGSGATIDDDPTIFLGNKGKYAILQNDILAPWDWEAWNARRIIILDEVIWIPEENLNDPIDNWAVKFEINVPDYWNGTTLFISSEHNDYRAFYEPWKDADGNTFPYRTDGWQTVTFPLSQFYIGWGGNEAAISIKDLIGDTGVSAIAIQTMNITDMATATGLNAAVDNIRVVRIK